MNVHLPTTDADDHIPTVDADLDVSELQCDGEGYNAWLSLNLVLLKDKLDIEFCNPLLLAFILTANTMLKCVRTVKTKLAILGILTNKEGCGHQRTGEVLDGPREELLVPWRGTDRTFYILSERPENTATWGPAAE
ncbi:hypothetical protein STEG23_013317, partial [Scotinomys teguina]